LSVRDVYFQLDQA